MSSPAPVVMKNRAAWRLWLSRNHTKEKEVWLVYAKKQSGIATVSYDEAVEEAICFGWIDGQARAVDDSYFMQRFSPRTKNSRWSELNIGRAKRMIDTGLMTDAGRVVFEDAMLQDRIVPSLEQYTVPKELENALASDMKAGENFRNLAPTHRLMYAAWVDSAKRPATRLKRAEQSLRFLRENKRLVDIFGIRKKQ